MEKPNEEESFFLHINFHVKNEKVTRTIYVCIFVTMYPRLTLATLTLKLKYNIIDLTFKKQNKTTYFIFFLFLFVLFLTFLPFYLRIPCKFEEQLQ